ncbi:Predicted O-linked N-acetylglucosamine transferase, SPINDLY family [Solimonas aquatica]|uniref:protein O-GlcNAc transferase n=1 Tax=Solimonas aquatica TaxID=489703 RepID=A0A1H9E367_9GAMM|nr:hypothetical protein [Solimonas aquatica]SEQ20042.1 Predicted O-linked N-acetylglucosamine transferase, SPINDLY family [Solimonas aquatica]
MRAGEDRGTPYQRALALSQAGESAAALALLQPAVQAPDAGFEALALAAALCEQLDRLDEALRLYERLAETRPGQASLCNAMGRVRAQLGQPAQALALFDAALAREPQNPETLFNRGNALRLLLRREAAIEAYRAVLPLHAEYARLALVEIARQQQALLDFTAARISYLQLYHASGGTLDAIGLRLANEHHIWPPDPAGIAALARELGEDYVSRHPAGLPPCPARRADARLRIGLVSADLWSHPVGHFIQALLGASAARAADWFVYSSRAAPADALTERLRTHMQVWHEVAGWPDARLAQQIREDGIDVLVDLSGYSAGHRLAAFAARPAPLQLSWLGYHGTTGLPFIDAVIADPQCVPEGESHFFTEPLLRLPQTRLCYTAPAEAPPISAAPVLRTGLVTFGCMQRAFKLGPQVLAAWARIAAALPEARWVLALGDPESGPEEHARLRRRCAEAGFTPAHLEIRGLRPTDEYLAGHADVDLLLDTFPYPGGTTTAAALWMGVPTLTLSVPGMLGRQGEQILKAAGLADWVTYSIDEYVAQAIARGRGAAQATWTAQRGTMRERLRGTPMFDTERFGRDWMAAVRGLWQQRHGDAEAEARLPSRERGPRFVFYVPACEHPFGGVKVIYEMVAALNRLGWRAFTHTPAGSKAGEFWSVSKHELAHWQAASGDIVIAPEVMDATWLRAVKAMGVPLWLLVQNWSYVGSSFVRDPLSKGPLFDGALVVSDSSEAIVRRCFPELPCLRTPPAIAAIPEAAAAARPAIAYMPRKLPELARWLRAVWPLAFPDLADVAWIEIDGLPHAQVLAQLQQARYFVSLQASEALGLPALEAMSADCLVIGFTGIGGREYARADNGIWLDEGDGPALLEALGAALRAERRQPGVHDAMRRAGRQTAARYSQAAQDQALLAAFTQIEVRQREREAARVGA